MRTLWAKTLCAVVLASAPFTGLAIVPDKADADCWGCAGTFGPCRVISSDGATGCVITPNHLCGLIGPGQCIH